jgi:deazaflavin-dependent oxidoreductase (nitroreductase family)
MPQRRYLEPSWPISRVVNPLLMRFGIVPTLRVRGRKTGHWRSAPVNVLELDGQRYLVAPRDETDWVRNLRVAGGGQLRYVRQRTEPFMATEVPDEENPIIEAYLQRWGGQVSSQVEALPDPADHPVVKVERSQ